MAYLGFHFGGKVQNIFRKVGVFALCFAQRVWGHAPQENLKKWCNLVRIGEYFACQNFVKNKIVKIIIFYIKIIDNVLLRTLCLGVLENTLQIFQLPWSNLKNSPMRKSHFHLSRNHLKSSRKNLNLLKNCYPLPPPRENCWTITETTSNNRTKSQPLPKNPNPS